MRGRSKGSLIRALAVTAAVSALMTGSLTTRAIPASAANPGTSGTVVNPYSPAYGHPYRHGAVPTIERHRQMLVYEQQHPSPITTASTGPETLAYGGGIDGIGVTSGTPKIYLVFWGSQWGSQHTDSGGNLTFSNDSAGGAPYIQKLFRGLGTGNELWSGTMTQYCDGSTVATGATSCPAGAPHIGYPTGGALAGVWYDNAAAEPSTASGHQIGQEAVNAAAHFGNTSPASNRYAQYDILSPKGLNPDGYQTGGFCAWHDYNGDTTLSGGAVNSPYGDIAFTNMPYVMDAGAGCGQNFVNSSGALDGYSIVNGHEYAETITDQNPAGGWTNQQNNSFGGEENGDECAWVSSGQGASANVTTSTGSFAMQSTWSNDTNRCDISHPIVTGTSGNDFSISANPASVSIGQGSSGMSTINTAVVAGAAGTVNLSASVSPSGPTMSFNPTSVTAGNSSTLTITVGSGVATGPYTVTVTGTEGSVVHTTTVNVTVTAQVTNDFSISANPTSVSIVQGSSGTSTINTAVTSGSAGTVSLSASVSPSGPTTSFSATSVTAGNSSTLTINVGSGVATGPYSVTVTGTEGSVTHTTTVSVTVTAPVANDFSISASPTNVSIVQGASGTSTINTVVTSGSAGTVSLSTSVSPSGPTAGVSPTSVTAGASSTLTVSVGSSVAPGPYTVTVTGTEGSISHSTTVNVTITAPSGGGITNGGFETGDFTGWTRSGTTSISTVAHSGLYSAMVGSTSATNGDSSVSQTFTVPSGMGTLSFYYQVHCPDTLTYDWATATLKDNTTGTTSTPLAKTCSNNNTWTQASTSVVAGHSLTLTLTSHDDNYPGDPTYTLYDDVTLGAAAPPPPTGITNGGFETGDFTGWTRAGATSISNTAHSGSHAAMIGSTSATNGDSSINQMFTVPSGTTTLSFYYQVHCPDTLTYDWATATLKDNTAGTTTTVLAKTCTNNNTWVHVTAGVVAGHSVTLTLISHDDNYAGDPTYTLYDDVTVS